MSTPDQGGSSMTAHEDALKDDEAKERARVANVVRGEWHASERALRKRFYRRASWPIVADKLRRRLQHAAEVARSEHPWEHLYVRTDDPSRSVSIWFGKHPLPGVAEEDIEVGASMVISQDSRGGIAVLLFPFESLNLRQRKPKLIWGYFDGPECICEKTILGMVRDFLRYGRATSGLMAASGQDRRTLERLEERSRGFESKTALAGLHPWAFGALVLGSLATLALFIAWLTAGDGDKFEPWTGIVALLTGWTSVWVQRLGRSRDEARARVIAAEDAERAERDRRLESKREMQKDRKRDEPRPPLLLSYKLTIGQHGQVRQQ